MLLARCAKSAPRKAVDSVQNLALKKVKISNIVAFYISRDHWCLLPSVSDLSQNLNRPFPNIPIDQVKYVSLALTRKTSLIANIPSDELNVGNYRPDKQVVCSSSLQIGYDSGSSSVPAGLFKEACHRETWTFHERANLGQNPPTFCNFWNSGIMMVVLADSQMSCSLKKAWTLTSMKLRHLQVETVNFILERVLARCLLCRKLACRAQQFC